MDIPRIDGGENIEIKITPADYNVNADVNTAGSPSGQGNEEIIPDIQEPPSDNLSDTTEQLSDEDYIKKFQQDYRNVVYFKVIPIIAKYENERKIL